MTHPAISSESEKSPFTGLDNSINSKFLMAILESLIDSMKENALVMSYDIIICTYKAACFSVRLSVYHHWVILLYHAGQIMCNAAVLPGKCSTCI